LEIGLEKPIADGENSLIRGNKEVFSMGMIFIRSRIDHHSMSLDFYVDEIDNGSSLVGYLIGDEVILLFRVPAMIGKQFQGIRENGISSTPDLLYSDIDTPPYLLMLHFVVVARDHSLDKFSEFSLREIMHGVYL
jgi:hypothetical protein